MSNKIFYFGLIVLFLFSGILFAKRPGGEMRMRHMEKALDLTEDQKSQMLDRHLQLRKDLLPLKSEQEKLRADLKMEMITEKFSEAKVKKIVDQISNLQKEMQMKRLMNQRAVRNLLTEEQKKKFDLHVLSREPRGKHRGQRDFRRHPGPIPSEAEPEN